MKLTAELALKQSLTITHDMRLAIDMLSMSATEIEDVIDEELLKNPYLEEDEHYEPTHGLSVSTSGAADLVSAFDVAMDTTSLSIDFRGELLQQVGENRFNVLERVIALHLINNLDDDGLLKNHLVVYHDIIDELGVFTEWIESVRLRIMELEPLGCAAHDGIEALLHQVKRRCQFPHQEFTAILARIKNNAAQKISFTRLQTMHHDGAMAELRKLNARPSDGFREEHGVVDAIIPEVLVRREKNDFVVSLTRKPSERLVLMTKLARSKQQFLKQSRKRALFMLKALHYRETSLATVSRAIVAHQDAWMREQGPLRPLNLREIADVCGLHESSISRLTKGKYLACDKGIFELKYFFSGKIAQGDDEMHTATTIKDQIKKIISKENRALPLSDQKIAEQLKMSGIVISRRTVAKYRESLSLDPAHLRRVLKAWG